MPFNFFPKTKKTHTLIHALVRKIRNKSGLAKELAVFRNLLIANLEF